MLLVVHLIFAGLSIPAMLGALINEFAHFIKNKKLLPVISAVSFVGLVSSGTALIIVDHGKVLGGCIEGLLYLAGLSIPYVIYKRVAAKESI